MEASLCPFHIWNQRRLVLSCFRRNLGGEAGRVDPMAQCGASMGRWKERGARSVHPNVVPGDRAHQDRDDPREMLLPTMDAGRASPLFPSAGQR